MNTRFAVCVCTDGAHEYPDRDQWRPDEMTARRDEVLYPAGTPLHVTTDQTTTEGVPA